tara:strand:+ start:7852 stop:9948 length:2097 start_codon:yes stop_codon:yes gene_type:complete
MANIHNYNTRISSGKLKRKNYSGDDDDNYDDTSDYSDTDNNALDDFIDTSAQDFKKNKFKNSKKSDRLDSKKLNKLEFYKFLNKAFPSQHMAHKLKKEQNKKPKLSVNDDSNHIIGSSTSNDVLKMLVDKYTKFRNTIDVENKDYDTETAVNNNKNKLLQEGITKLFELFSKDNNINIIINLQNDLDNYTLRSNEEYDDDEEYEDEEEYEEEDDDNKEYDDKKSEAKSKAKSKSNSKAIPKLDIVNNTDNENATNDDNDKQNVETIIIPSKKVSMKNYKKFDKVLDENDKEFDYFKNNLSENLQVAAIDKLNKIKQLTNIEKPYLIHLIDLDIPDDYKVCALRKINMLRSMTCGLGANGEYYKIKAWVDAFIKIPFNKYNNLPITFADGIEQCHDFMANAKKMLDSVTYGLEDAKIQIMQMIGLWLVNPNAIGSAIAIKGPPGTGKTTLIKDGISKILNRPFALIALGGCGDSGFLDGFDYTYEGSKYGKIIDILIKSGCMNPVILFDELDKISDSFKGQEITGVLTHLTDTTQNNNFSDKYMSEISLDMSKALYIFSYNDENCVNNILKDRMYKIETVGYKTKDKLIIAKDYLLPKIREQAKFGHDEIIFTDAILEYIITDFTETEQGVRNLKRCLEIIYTKLNLYRLMKPDINLFSDSETMNIKEKIIFPISLTHGLIDKLIKKADSDKIPYGIYN